MRLTELLSSCTEVLFARMCPSSFTPEQQRAACRHDMQYTFSPFLTRALVTQTFALMHRRHYMRPPAAFTQALKPCWASTILTRGLGRNLHPLHFI
eukprot:6198614-Pleurochrysis_carterae.AAC.2